MMSKGVDHWITSPYCFCQELPWLVLSGLRPSSAAALLGGWGWEEWAILAASLIALALLLLLLSLLACLLCPSCCPCCCSPRGRGRGSESGLCLCCRARGGGGFKGKDRKKGLGAGGHTLEMSSIGGSEESNLTAEGLKLPRAWMDTPKGGLTDERGDLGLGGGGYFGNQKTWNSANGDATGWGGGGGGGGGGIHRSGQHGAHSRRSAHARQSPYDVDSLDGGGGVHEGQSTRTEVYRNQATVTVIDRNIGEHIREAVQEWQQKSGLVSQKLQETRQSRNETGQDSGHGKAGGGFHQQQQQQQQQQQVQGLETYKSSGQEANSFGYSTVTEAVQRDAHCEEEQKASSMALVKSSASGAHDALVTSGGSGGAPIMQCYTVTKKTTTTTYGDEEGDEETSVVTTTEKQWREGMKEVGEISVAAAATVGELLPEIGAPAQVLNDVSNVRMVRSLTNVDGGVSNVVRRYEYQQTMKDSETLL